MLSFGLLRAATVYSVANGDWQDSANWSTGTVPAPGDDIFVAHQMEYAGELQLSSTGELHVLPGASVRIEMLLVNEGLVQNEGEIFSAGVDNKGRIENSGTYYVTGTFENRSGGYLLNSGLIQLTGDMENHGTVELSGQIVMTGDYENYGTTFSPAGTSGYIADCGSTTHRSGAYVTGTVYVCISCGGSYVKQSGAHGDFIEECGLFPIVISSFAARLEADGVHLNWVTAQESNARRFEVEWAHSQLGEDCIVDYCGAELEFTKVAELEAKGNSSRPSEYAYTHAAPAKGANFYRLRMLDFDGIYSTSRVVQVVVSEVQPSLVVFPNPTNETLHVRIAGESGTAAELKLFTIDGRLVWQEKRVLATEFTTLEVSVCEFASGAYIMQYNYKGQNITRKVIFQR